MARRGPFAEPPGDNLGREFDVLVLGPGYQGGRVINELVALLGGSAYRLAAAGRDGARVAVALQDLNAMGRVEAIGGCAAADEAGMRQLARRTRVLISCCGGEFVQTGPSVVAACVAEGTHYLDASLGCPMEDVESVWAQLQREHQQTAAASGAVVINALGCDTLLADFGTLLTVRRFKPPTVPYCVGSFLTLEAPRGYKLRRATFLQQAKRPPGPASNLLSHPSSGGIVVAAAAAVSEEAALGGEAGAGKGEEGEGLDEALEALAACYAAPPPEGANAALGRCPELNCWAVRGAACEAPLVQETQALLLQQAKAGGGGEEFRAVHYEAHLTMSSPLPAVWLAGSAYLPQWGSALLRSQPAVSLLTRVGLVTDSPSQFEDTERAKSFRKAFVGRGYRSRAEARSEGAAADVVHIATIVGPSPGYAVTPAALALAAVVLLEERPAVNCPGGFSTPVAALRNTTFWARLQELCGLKVIEESRGAALAMEEQGTQ